MRVTIIPQFADVAQWLEQGFHKAKVAGSTPAIGTTENGRSKKHNQKPRLGGVFGDQ